MIRYLSSEWVAAVHEALSATSIDPAVSVVIEQRVTGGPDGDRVFHLGLGGGRANIGIGPADAPDVHFTQTWAVASAIARGTRSAQAAFIAGDLRVGGDVRRLIDAAPALAVLADLTGDLRTRTDFGDDR